MTDLPQGCDGGNKPGSGSQENSGYPAQDRLLRRRGALGICVGTFAGICLGFLGRSELEDTGDSSMASRASHRPREFQRSIDLLTDFNKEIHHSGKLCLLPVMDNSTTDKLISLAAAEHYTDSYSEENPYTSASPKIDILDVSIDKYHEIFVLRSPEVVKHLIPEDMIEGSRRGGGYRKAPNMKHLIPQWNSNSHEFSYIWCPRHHVAEEGWDYGVLSLINPDGKRVVEFVEDLGYTTEVRGLGRDGVDVSREYTLLNRHNEDTDWALKNRVDMDYRNLLTAIVVEEGKKKEASDLA